MPTNIDTGVTVSTALATAHSQHTFVMSNGDIAVIYYSGTTWGYRVKHGGTWGAFTALTSTGTTGEVPTTNTPTSWSRNGDTLYGVIDGFNSVGGTTQWSLVYNTATQTFTQTANNATGNGARLLGSYWDNQNARFVFLEDMGAGTGVWLSAVTSALVNAYSTVLTGPAGGEPAVNCGLVGDTTGTFYAYVGTGTTFKVTKIVATATAHTDTAETSVPVPAATVQGVAAIYDGTNIVFALNENNAKLRTSRRTAANTYDAWSDLDASTIAGEPVLSRKGTGAASDLAVIYERTSGQANGEIYDITRVGGTWGARSLLAGGAATGWSSPSSAMSDLNDTSGTIRLVYLTGTANPWTLVEDAVTIAAGSSSTSPPDQRRRADPWRSARNWMAIR